MCSQHPHTHNHTESKKHTRMLRAFFELHAAVQITGILLYTHVVGGHFPTTSRSVSHEYIFIYPCGERYLSSCKDQ